MARQMTLDERKRIDFLLQLGWTPVQIAKEMGRSKTTVIREIINRSVACDRGYRCSNRICANFDVCSRPKGYGANPNRLFRCTAGCYEVCPDFVERNPRGESAGRWLEQAKGNSDGPSEAYRNDKKGADVSIWRGGVAHVKTKSTQDRRLPSGSFAVNELVLALSTLSFNILRIIGQTALEVRGETGGVSCLRLRTVLLNYIYVGAICGSHGGRRYLRLGRNCHVADVFMAIGARLAA